MPQRTADLQFAPPPVAATAERVFRKTCFSYKAVFSADPMKTRGSAKPIELPPHWIFRFCRFETRKWQRIVNEWTGKDPFVGAARVTGGGVRYSAGEARWRGISWNWWQSRLPQHNVEVGQYALAYLVNFFCDLQVFLGPVIATFV